jgi:hypothetical protein
MTVQYQTYGRGITRERGGAVGSDDGDRHGQLLEVTRTEQRWRRPLAIGRAEHDQRRHAPGHRVVLLVDHRAARVVDDGDRAFGYHGRVIAGCAARRLRRPDRLPGEAAGRRPDQQRRLVDLIGAAVNRQRRLTRRNGKEPVELRRRYLETPVPQRLRHILYAGVVARRAVSAAAAVGVGDVLQRAQVGDHPVRGHLSGQSPTEIRPRRRRRSQRRAPRHQPDQHQR